MLEPWVEREPVAAANSCSGDIQVAVPRPKRYGPYSVPALGGGRLDGGNLVRLVYSDEAGISNPKQEPFLVVASIIVHADQKLNAIERHLDSLINRHIPEQSRSDFIFHAKELFLGGKVIKRNDPFWPDEKRFSIADDLAAIPKKFDLPIAFGWLERAHFPVTFEYPENMSAHDRAIAEHTSAFMSSAMVVEHWMRQHASN